MNGYEKAGVIKDRDVLAAYAETHTNCQVCGRRFFEWRVRELHHIVHGANGRSDEPCNLLALCHRCHALGVHDGHLKWNLTTGNVLWCKRQFDPENWRPERLKQLWHRASLPDLEPLPAHYLDERRRAGK